MNKKRNKDPKTYGVKIGITILILLITVTTLGQGQITGKMNLTKKEIYRTESTTLKAKISNHIGGHTVDDIKLKLQNQELELEEEYSLGELSPGQSWTIEPLEIQTNKETPVGNHSIQANLQYEETAMKLVPMNLKIKENPLKLQISLEKGETPREGTNTLQIEAENIGNNTLNQVTIDPDFGKLAYLNIKGKCRKQIDSLNPKESFTGVCEFQATEESPSEYDLPIHSSFIDQEEEKHEFKDYKKIPVESGINLPGLKAIVIGVLIIATLILLVRRFL